MENIINFKGKDIEPFLVPVIKNKKRQFARCHKVYRGDLFICAGCADKGEVVKTYTFRTICDHQKKCEHTLDHEQPSGRPRCKTIIDLYVRDDVEDNADIVYYTPTYKEVHKKKKQRKKPPTKETLIAADSCDDVESVSIAPTVLENGEESKKTSSQTSSNKDLTTGVASAPGGNNSNTSDDEENNDNAQNDKPKPARRKKFVQAKERKRRFGLRGTKK